MNCPSISTDCSRAFRCRCLAASPGSCPRPRGNEAVMNCSKAEPRQVDLRAHQLRRYLRRHGEIPGWLDDFSARFIAEIGRIQAERGVKGSVAEIGVHMGRLFILLKLLVSPDERALALDIFAHQQLNVDGSGG